MATVNVTLPHHRYEVRIEPGSLVRLGLLVREASPHDRAALVVDEQIASSHGRVAARSLSAADYDTQVANMPTGEKHKTLGTVRGLYEVLLNARLERKSPVVALGGGITGDTAGFVAATYLRGVPLVQCPTTLLAMVDASVGGKVGVNVPQGKNLIGAFHQPTLVVIDPDTLRTLPERELRCGLAECVKHAVIRDEALFDWLEDRRDDILKLDSDTMTTLVERNVAIKAAVVMEDEKEAGVRAHLNFGHTFAHAIEAGTEYGTYHHGEAVSLGMVAATRLAVDRGLCRAGVLDRLVTLLEAVGLPTSAEDLPAAEKLLDLMRSDKKVADGRIRLVLPTRLGEVVIVNDAPDEAIAAAWGALSEKPTD
ncbi:3-dehydroquinate synthase [Phycisphaerales bacterium AB-hyl4]|uniref:3-dehydroquinate synthase n=1 Tax=Natronomicrosphaera hydrolytica TaxID=3242702 RepID=A0ABV4U1N1_9BACT